MLAILPGGSRYYTVEPSWNMLNISAFRGSGTLSNEFSNISDNSIFLMWVFGSTDRSVLCQRNIIKFNKMFELCNRCEFWFYVLFPINAMLYNYKKWLGITFTILLAMAIWAQNFYASYKYNLTPYPRVIKAAISPPSFV